MFVQRLVRQYGVLAVVLLCATMAFPAAQRLYAQPQVEVLKFEIAEIPVRYAPSPFAFDEKTGMGSHGNPFVTQGYIYPAGTLKGGDGIKPDGSPLYPDKVLGEWSCWGFVAGGDNGRPVTTQQFQLGLGFGERTIITSGYEILDGTTSKRAIIGGTGVYASISGEQIQTFLGLTPYPPYGGAKFSVELRVTR
jgi:hypothetical protein